jgi:plasmid stability protein
MSKMIQIRNVPDDVHRTVKKRAAEAGMTLSDYLLRDIMRAARRPTFDEIVREVDEDGPVDLPEDSAALIRELRDAE